MSPAGLSDFQSRSTVWRVNNTGSIDYNSFYKGNALSIRPVINLKSDTKISSGDGTKNNPFVVE